MQKKVTKLKRCKQTDWSPKKIADYTHYLNSLEAKLSSLLKSMFSVSVTALGLLIVLSTIKVSRGFYHTYLWYSALCFVTTIFTVLWLWVSMARSFEIKLKCFYTNNYTEIIALSKEQRMNKIINNIIISASIIFFFVGVICAVEFSFNLYSDIKEQEMKETQKDINVLRTQIEAKEQKVKEQIQQIKKQRQEIKEHKQKKDALNQKREKQNQEEKALLKELKAVKQKIKELEKKLQSMPE